MLCPNNAMQYTWNMQEAEGVRAVKAALGLGHDPATWAKTRIFKYFSTFFYIFGP